MRQIAAESGQRNTAAGPYPFGTRAALGGALYETRWAAPFVAAVRRNGGVPVAFERIRMEDLIDALDAAEAAS